MTETASTMRSLERAIDVLEVLDAAVGPLRLSEIARRVGLPVATTQRILATLESRDRVERDAYGYRPGVGLAFGAHAYASSNPLIRAARPVLMDLAASTGLTATLFREHRGQRVVLARADNASNLLAELVVGARLPLALGAGKALLASLDDDDARAVLADAARPGDPEDPPGSTAPSADEAGWPALRAELQAIRDRGYSVSLGERDPAVGSVAAALPGAWTVPAAVQISGPIDALKDPARQQDLGRRAQRAAFRIAQDHPRQT